MLVHFEIILFPQKINNASYLSDILNFLQWVIANEKDWLTEYGSTHLDVILQEVDNEGVRAYHGRCINSLKGLLRESFVRPIVQIHCVTPSRYMEYIITLSARNGGFLSKSAYGNKRSALFHLFRLHNHLGFGDDFKAELGGLYKAMYRTVAQNRAINQI